MYVRRIEVETVKLEIESRELELEVVAWKEPGCKLEVWASERDRPIVLGEGGNVTLRGQAMLVRLAVGSGVRVSIEADFNLGGSDCGGRKYRGTLPQSWGGLCKERLAWRAYRLESV